MLDRSPEASDRVFRRAASAIAVTSPRSRARSDKSIFLNSLASLFFNIRLLRFANQFATKFASHEFPTRVSLVTSCGRDEAHPAAGQPGRVTKLDKAPL